MPAAGIPYHAIPTGKLRRQLAWRNVTDLTLRVPAGFGRALALLGRLRPDVVVATGGFVAVPTAVAAAARRLPLLVHEQVVVPGLANRLIGRLADRVAVTFAASASAFPKREGRGHRQPDPPGAPHGPAGPRVRALRPRSRRSRSRYVTGGALGAHRVNRVVGAALPALLAVDPDRPSVAATTCTATSRGSAARPSRLPPPLAARYRVVALVGEELGDLYAAASLVVGRAGRRHRDRARRAGLARDPRAPPGRSRGRADGERARPGRRGRRGLSCRRRSSLPTASSAR